MNEVKSPKKPLIYYYMIADRAISQYADTIWHVPYKQ